MPTYEYQCTHCDHQMEIVQAMSDPPLAVCPECGEPALKKLISASAFHLKGSGWYVTEYGKKRKEKDQQKEKEKSKPKEGAESASKKADKPKTEAKTKTGT